VPPDLLKLFGLRRDLKGANLFVDASGIFKLADFGIAKHVSFYLFTARLLSACRNSLLICGTFECEVRDPG